MFPARALGRGRALRSLAAAAAVLALVACTGTGRGRFDASARGAAPEPDSTAARIVAPAERTRTLSAMHRPAALRGDEGAVASGASER